MVESKDAVNKRSDTYMQREREGEGEGEGESERASERERERERERGERERDFLRDRNLADSEKAGRAAQKNTLRPSF